MTTVRAETCRDARQGLAFYRLRFRHWTEERGAGDPGRRPDPGGCAHVRFLIPLAKERGARARALYVRWWSYAWSEWLPAKWQRIARCETHLRFDWDSGTYVSAFGIYRPAYDDDAAHVGMPPWSSGPTPREQYLTARAHYALHGGFSGWGCRNA